MFMAFNFTALSDLIFHAEGR